MKVEDSNITSQEVRTETIAPTAPVTETPPKPAERTNTYLWGLRFLQILFAIIIVGIAGSNISDWHSLGCSSPAGLSYNFAIGLISLFLILYLLLSTGPHAKLPYTSTLFILIAESLFILLWIVAAALASYNCTSLCNVCSGPGYDADNGYGFFVWANDLTCYCTFDYDNNLNDVSFRRDAPGILFKRASPKPYSGGGNGNVGKLAKTAEKGVSRAAKEGLDAGMILLLVTSLITLLYLRYSNRGTASVDHDAELVDQHVENAVKMEPVVGPSAE